MENLRLNNKPVLLKLICIKSNGNTYSKSTRTTISPEYFSEPDFYVGHAFTSGAPKCSTWRKQFAKLSLLAAALMTRIDKTVCITFLVYFRSNRWRFVFFYFLFFASICLFLRMSMNKIYCDCICDYFSTIFTSVWQ